VKTTFPSKTILLISSSLWCGSWLGCATYYHDSSSDRLQASPEKTIDETTYEQVGMIERFEKITAKVPYESDKPGDNGEGVPGY
jgi:hypothetical protein